MVNRGALSTAICAALLLTCRSSTAPRAAGANGRACAQIPQVEAQRHGALAALEPCLTSEDTSVRRLAIRALGRIGEAAVARLRALPALGLDVWTARALAGIAPEPRAQLERLPPEDRAAALWSIGRAEAPPDHALLGAGLADADAGVRAWAGITLGLLGRAEKPLDDTLRQKLTPLGQESNAAVRFGATYAWAKEFEPPDHSPGTDALRGRLTDADPEIRALAWTGLGRRGALDGAPLRAGLDDPDWRVRVEVIRAYTGPHGTPALHAELAAWLGARPLGPDTGHDWLTALDGLLGAAREEAVQRALPAWQATATAALEGDEPLLASAVHCLVAAARVRAGAPLREVESCGGPPDTGLPVWERRRLWVELIRLGQGGDLAARLGSFERFRADPDPRVRAQVISQAMSSEDQELRDAAARAALDALRAENGDSSSVVVGSIADAIAGDGLTPSAELASALLGRLDRTKADPEVTLSLLNALRTANDPRTRAACEARASDPNPAVRRAAHDVFRELYGEELRPRVEPVPKLPPLDASRVLGHEVLWRLETSRGDIEIALDAEVAPWSVAALVELTERGVYKDSLWHRVVPNFVVQGGDPTGSGWGGPGFTLPTEASSLPFRRGAVGIADAGKDTGGSQFFIMHSRAPHLEGRYTLVGYVVRGMEVVDRLQVGDQLIDAEVEIR